MLLLLTAAIWGFAFVAQRSGMEYVGPFLFNALRFGLGCLSLGIVLLLRRQKETVKQGIPVMGNTKVLAKAGIYAGAVLFLGASLQQTGIVYTTAGKAGFITGLYVIIVPFLGLLWGQRTGAGTLFGAVVAAVGLYLLSIAGKFAISLGDGLVLIGAFVWAAHVHIIGWFSPKVAPIKLAFTQFAICSMLSFIVSIIFEANTLLGIYRGAIPILYGGFMSAGVAFTLQVVAQRDAHPSHAAVIMSLEAAFAALGGRLILGEILTSRGLLGCAFMLMGMVLSSAFGISKHGNPADIV